MSSHEHTPTPWEIKDISARTKNKAVILGVFGPSEIIAGLDGIAVPDHFNDRTFVEDRANMAFIVQCVNAHDELVEALEIASNSCRDVTELGRFSPSVDPARWVAQLKAHIDAALEKAGRS